MPPTPGPTVRPSCWLGADLLPTPSPPPGTTTGLWARRILGQYPWQVGADSSRCLGLEVWWGWSAGHLSSQA